MRNWKRVVGFGALGAGAALFLSGRRPVGTVVAAAGALTLIGEYPEQFQNIVHQAPEWLERGNRMVGVASRIASRVAEMQAGGGLRNLRDLF